jgi:hypothetical protein
MPKKIKVEAELTGPQLEALDEAVRHCWDRGESYYPQSFFSILGRAMNSLHAGIEKVAKRKRSIQR